MRNKERNQQNDEGQVTCKGTKNVLKAIDAYRLQRKLQEKVGLLAFWGGLLLLLVDMSSPFPTPARGAFAMWWLLVVGIGAAAWIRSRKLPVEQTLMVAEKNGGVLTSHVLSMELGVTFEMATKSLELMCEYGEAEEVVEEKNRSWRFFNVNSDS